MHEILADTWAKTKENALGGEYDHTDQLCSDLRGQSFVIHLGLHRHYTAGNTPFILTSHPAVKKLHDSGILFFKAYTLTLQQFHAC